MNVCFYDHVYVLKSERKIIEREIINPIRQAGFNVDHRDPDELFEGHDPYDILLVHPYLPFIELEPELWKKTLIESTQKPTLILTSSQVNLNKLEEILGYRSSLEYSNNLLPNQIISFLEKY